MCIALFLASAYLAAASQQAGSPGAGQPEVIAFLDLEEFRASSMGQKLLEITEIHLAFAQDSGLYDPEYAEFKRESGLEMVRDFDSFRVLADRETWSSADFEFTDLVIAIRGRHSPARLGDYLRKVCRQQASPEGSTLFKCDEWFVGLQGDEIYMTGQQRIAGALEGRLAVGPPRRTAASNPVWPLWRAVGPVTISVQPGDQPRFEIRAPCPDPCDPGNPQSVYGLARGMIDDTLFPYLYHELPEDLDSAGQEWGLKVEAEQGNLLVGGKIPVAVIDGLLEEIRSEVPE